MLLSPIILAGGVGTRLWPLSREHYPKQFINLINEKSMLQNTLNRLRGLENSIEVSSPLIVCNEVHRFLVADQCEEIQQSLDSIILESVGRNTAPALTIAALKLTQAHDDVMMLMMPADHVIKNIAMFQQAILVASNYVEKDYLFTFGISPDYPDTGYGYIHFDKAKDKINDLTVNAVLGFKEKPNKETAKQYIIAGDYLWNSGIFMMKASVWLKKMEQYNQDIVTSCREAINKGHLIVSFYVLMPKHLQIVEVNPLILVSWKNYWLITQNKY